MRLSILIFDSLTVLDAIGGYEVLSRIPGVEVEFVAAHRGIVAADTRRLGLLAYRDFSEVQSTDILYVPGGPGARALESDPEFIDYLRLLDSTSTWTIGICNGVTLLAIAGLLKGRQATTNWLERKRLLACRPIAGRFARGARQALARAAVGRPTTGIRRDSVVWHRPASRTVRGWPNVACRQRVARWILVNNSSEFGGVCG